MLSGPPIWYIPIARIYTLTGHIFWWVRQRSLRHSQRIERWRYKFRPSDLIKFNTSQMIVSGHSITFLESLSLAFHDKASDVDISEESEENKESIEQITENSEVTSSATSQEKLLEHIEVETEVVVFFACISSSKFKLFESNVALAAEGTFGGGNLRGPNIQPIPTTLIYIQGKSHKAYF
jgi:hypothetical protein